MPRIPRVEAKEVSLPRASILSTEHPAAIAGRAVTQSARILADVAKAMKEARQTTDFSNAITDIIRQRADFHSSLDQRTDFDTFEKDHKEFFRKLKQDYHKKTVADQTLWKQLATWIDRAEVESLVKTRSIARRKQIDSGRADYIFDMSQLDTELERANADERKAIIEEGIRITGGNFQAGIISKVQATTALDKLKHQGDVIEAWQQARSLPYEEALSWLATSENTPELEEHERITLISRLKRQAGLEALKEQEERDKLITDTQNAFIEALRKGELTEEMILSSPLEPMGTGSRDYFLRLLDARSKAALAAQEEEGEELIEATQHEFISALRQGTLTEEQILESSLPATRKEHFLAILDEQERARKEGRKSPVNITDADTYAAWSYRVNVEPDKISSASEIFTDVGKGLSVSDAEKLVRAWRANRTKPEEAKDPLETTDPRVYSSWSYLVNTFADGITSAKEIYADVGQGLSINDVEKLVKLWNANRTKPDKTEDPLRSQRSKRYHSILKRLATDNIFGEDDKENELVYGKKANLMDDYLITHPEATDQEIEQFFDDLVADEKEAWYARAWNWLFGEEKTEEIEEEIEEGEGSLRDQAIEILKRNGLAITEENVEKVIKRLEQ